MKTEMKKGMPFKEYLAVKACHKSALSHTKTGKHLKKFETKKMDTDALRFGRIFHTALLEPDEMGDVPVYSNMEWIPKNDHPDGKSINEQKAAFKEETEHYFANDDEKLNCEMMVEAINNNPLASKYLSKKGDAEVSFFWTDPRTGLPCKTRVDYLTEEDIIVEVKTDIDPSPEEFGKKVYNFGYQIGAWFNREGFRETTGRDIKAFIFIATEKKDPFTVGVYLVNAHDFDSGEIYGVPEMIRYKMIKRGGFQDHNQREDGEYEIIPVHTPNWELKIIDDAMGEIEAPEEESEL